MLQSLLMVLGGSVPFLATVFVVAKANCVKTNRYRQLFLPVVAVVYGVVLIVWFNDINNLIQYGLGMLARFVPPLASLNTAFVEAVVFNCLFMLAFAAVKTAYRGVMMAASKPYESALKGLFGAFYDYDEEYEHWYLSEEYRGVRRLFRNLFYAAAVIATLLFLASRGFSDLPAFRNPFYPAYAVVVIGEVFFFLDGLTKEEYKQSVEFEDDQAARVFQYAKVQKSLEHYFGDRVLHAFSRSRRRTSAGSHHDFCEELSHSAQFSERVAGAYFMALTDKGLVGRGSVGDYDELNHDVVMSVVKLLEGKSVMFASPFYRDYLPYVFLPMNAQLLRDGKALVLHAGESGTDASADNAGAGLAGFVSDGLAFVTNVRDMWTVGSLPHEGDAYPDVAIMPFSDLGDTRTILRNSDFFKQVSFALVIDPSSMLATYQVGLNILAEHLSVGRDVAYCIFDKNSDGLVDSLSHALRTNLTEVGATEYCEGTSVGMLWSVDGEFVQHRLFPDVAHYLGFGSELGLVALCAQISKSAWAARDSVPLVDQRWILGQYYGEIFRFANLPQEQGQVDKRFEFYPDMWSMPKEPRRFVVAEDEFNNLFEMSRQFSTRGSEEAFVNVLSPNYLLRDYMVQNSDMFAKDPKAIPAFAPDYSKSERNVVFSIVMMMVQGERRLLEGDVAARLRYAGVLDGRSVREALEGMMIEHFEVADDDDLPENHIVVTEVSEYVPALRDIVTNRYYELGEDARISTAFESLRNVPLITEAPDGSEMLLGSRLYGHVYQLFLPGQFLTVEGKYYEVLSMSSDGGVMLRRAADHFTRRRYYRQLRSYAVSDWEESERPGDTRTIGGIRISQGRASIIVETAGYLDLADYGDLEDVRRIELSDIPVRRYCNKSLLRIDFQGASSAAVTTLAVLMSELFKTLYPKDHSYIAVLAPACELLPEGVLYSADCPESESCVYIVEDSLIDIGLVSSIDRNIMRVLEMCWDYLDWHGDMMEGKRPEPERVEVGEFPGDPEPYEPPKGLFGRLVDRIKGLFGIGKQRKRKGGEGDGSPAAPESPAASEPEAKDEPEFAFELEPESEPEPESEHEFEGGFEQEPESEPTSAPEPKSEPDEGDEETQGEGVEDGD
ncbi:MAG: hypothetical protein IJ111_02575 [Eggerthellaceae bacterium]|nr:hypothetical protein [Eggerthellaceae bacterium]